MASSSGKGKRKENPNNGSSKTTLGPFPVGYKFKPTDKELITCYLWPKVHNRELPPNLMHDIDLYQLDESFDPEQLSAHYAPQGEGEWYFFTPRNKKYPNGKRPSRASAGGYWKASCRDEDIMSNGKHIGYRKSLVFHKGKQLTGVKTSWIMHEFRLKYDNTNSPQQLQKDPESTKIRLDDWVLFRIHYNTKGAKQAKKQATPEADINNRVDNPMTNPAQFPGHPSNDLHQCGLWGVLPTLENVMSANDNAVTMPTHYNVYYHQYGQSSSYSTLEDVKVTYDNTVTIPTQFSGYQSGVLSSGPSNANSKAEDVHITNDNTVTIPTQFPAVFENTAGNDIWPSSFHNFDNISMSSILSMINFDENQTNCFESVGNTGSANPILATPSFFGGLGDFNFLTSDMELFPGPDQLPRLPDFTGEFDDNMFV